MSITIELQNMGVSKTAFYRYKRQGYSDEEAISFANKTQINIIGQFLYLL